MSAEAPRNSGTGEPVPPQRYKDGFPGLLRRFFGVSVPQPKIVQLPEELERTATNLQGEIKDISFKPALPESGVPLNLTAELNGIINTRITQEQEAVGKQEEKARQEAESKLRKQEEETRQESEVRIWILTHNERSKEIAMVSGMREFFYQAYARLVQDYPSAIIEEGWGDGFDDRRAPQRKLSQVSSKENSEDYFVRLLWIDSIGAGSPIDRENGEYQYAQGNAEVWHAGAYRVGDELYETLRFNNKLTFKRNNYTQTDEFSESRILTKDEWQNPEEVKKAIIEAIKSPIHHSKPMTDSELNWAMYWERVRRGWPKEKGGG